MRKFFMIMSLVFVFISCQEEVFPTGYQIQIVRKGNNYCDGSSVVYSFTGRTFIATVKLDTSLFVHNEGSYQNKLLGFSEDEKVQNNSARVSFHTVSNTSDPLKDELVLKTYVYNNGIRLTDTESNKELLRVSYKDVLAGLGHDSIRFEIEMTSNKYVFRVNNSPSVLVSRVGTLMLDSPKYVLKLYYGGTPTAPHTMRMAIKYDPSMKGDAQNMYFQ